MRTFYEQSQIHNPKQKLFEAFKSYILENLEAEFNKCKQQSLIGGAPKAVVRIPKEELLFSDKESDNFSLEYSVLLQEPCSVYGYRASSIRFDCNRIRDKKSLSPEGLVRILLEMQKALKVAAEVKGDELIQKLICDSKKIDIKQHIIPVLKKEKVRILSTELPEKNDLAFHMEGAIVNILSLNFPSPENIEFDLAYTEAKKILADLQNKISSVKKLEPYFWTNFSAFFASDPLQIIQQNIDKMVSAVKNFERYYPSHINKIIFEENRRSQTPYVDLSIAASAAAGRSNC